MCKRKRGWRISTPWLEDLCIQCWRSENESNRFILAVQKYLKARHQSLQHNIGIHQKFCYYCIIAHIYLEKKKYTNFYFKNNYFVINILKHIKYVLLCLLKIPCNCTHFLHKGKLWTYYKYFVVHKEHIMIITFNRHVVESYCKTLKVIVGNKRLTRSIWRYTVFQLILPL